MLPCSCTPDSALIRSASPRAGQARNSKAQPRQKLQYWEAATGKHDLMDRDWISPLHGASLVVSPEVRISNSHRTTATRQGRQGHPMKSEESEESTPGGVSRLTRPMPRPCHLAASSEERGGRGFQGSWFTLTDSRQRKKERERRIKTSREKGGKRESKTRAKRKKERKSPEKPHPLKYCRNQRADSRLNAWF